ncbi:EF-P lysine aminoacylase GenX [Candidatus Roizmanbacteria bacterium]|nr:EF-P lysine aminoacylase GenX [Candidatus Roizmanbacteria bacterium]
MIQIKQHQDNIKAYKIYLRATAATREYLATNGYLELELPVLSPVLIPESYLEIFETQYRFLDHKEPLYLAPSPELFMKRVLAYQKLNCFSLGKAFRNGETNSSRHAPEFTMLEFYKLGADYLGIADELLHLMQHIAEQLFQSHSIVYQGKEISLKQWEQVSVTEAFERYAGIDSAELFDTKLFVQKAEKKGYTTAGFSYEDIFSQIYAQEIEPHLGKNGYPTLLYDYPKEFAALAKLNPDGKTAQRFEFYIDGIELGDCYTELTDWQEQQERFLSEQEKRKENGLIAHPTDEGFIAALQHGLPPCAGIAIGFERLAMIFANVSSIHELKLIEVY